MKSTQFCLALLLLVGPAPAHALIVDTIVGGAKYMKDEAYQAFMKIKVIEQIRILKQTYDSSMRYYKEFQRLNGGKGLVHNVGDILKNTAEEMGDELRSSVDRDFVHTYNTDTKVDRFFQSVDRGIADNMRYAGKGLANVISGKKMGVAIAKNANGLSPKDAANLNAKAQGIQIQMMAQIHEDNLRLIEIMSMQLANDTRRQQGEQRLIRSIRKSVEKRAPGAAPLEKEEGGNQ
jgi:hypothetical protein